jgi:dihydroorotate dehydrogenase
MIARFIISPPFGTWVSVPGADRVLGSFTFLPRPGRLRQIVRTVRPTRGGWVNAIGLRNPGIQNIGPIDPRSIYSLAAIEPDDWLRMAEYLAGLSEAELYGMRVEMNLSCPNVAERGVARAEIEAFTHLDHVFPVVTAKVSPVLTIALAQAAIAVEAGVHHLHVGNTLPVARGGLSGVPLLDVTPCTVEALAKLYPTVEIIGGGGISRREHVQMYASAGATRFSISTGCLHPLRIRRLITLSPLRPVAARGWVRANLHQELLTCSPALRSHCLVKPEAKATLTRAAPDSIPVSPTDA